MVENLQAYQVRNIKVKVRETRGHTKILLNFSLIASHLVQPSRSKRRMPYGGVSLLIARQSPCT